MDKRISKITILVVGFVLTALVVTGCGGGPVENGQGDQGGKAFNEESAQDNGNADSGMEGLPVSISAYDSSYKITSVEVTEGDDGTTVVACEGSGFDVLPIRNGSMVPPIYCSVIEGGTETEFASMSTESGTIKFLFNSLHDPDTVVFYPGDNEDDRHEVKVK